MVAQKPFPLTDLQSLQPLEIEKLQALRINTVQGLVNRMSDLSFCEELSYEMRWSDEEYNHVFQEAYSMVGRQLPVLPPQGTGALPNPGSEWMMGRTAGEINLVNFVKRTRLYLGNPTDTEKQALLKEADYLMQFLDVE